MKTVNEILLAKANKLLSIPPDASVLDALKLMAERGRGAGGARGRETGRDLLGA
jgi:CBS domain-containing protein